MPGSLLVISPRRKGPKVPPPPRQGQHLRSAEQSPQPTPLGYVLAPPSQVSGKPYVPRQDQAATGGLDWAACRAAEAGGDAVLAERAVAARATGLADSEIRGSFSLETGLPSSITRRDLDVSCYVHAREFLQAVWPTAAARSRVSLLEALSVALPSLTRDLAGTSDPDVHRLAVRRALNQNPHARQPDAAERHALAWLERASLSVSALDDPAIVRDLLDVLGRTLDGAPASADYFSRRRRVMHRVLSYAVRRKRLAANPHP